MKKFLTKKPVMISLIVAAVLVLALYIGMLARPVAIGWKYKLEQNGETATVQFTGKKMIMESSQDKEELYYYLDGHRIVPLMVENDEQYKEAVEEMKKMKKEDAAAYEAYLEMMPEMKVNAFTFTMSFGDETQSGNCAGTIVFAVVAGVIELVLIAGAVASIICNVKHKGDAEISNESSNEVSEKSRTAALLLNFFLGGLGVHRFYAGKVGTGLLWLFTGGCFGIGILIDFIMIVSGGFKDKEGKVIKNWN